MRTAQDGHAALAEVERQPPDLVVSDVMMPGLDGAALHRELRARGHRLPVVLFSAAHHPRLPSDVPFLAKPFEIERLLAVVAASLAGR